MTTVVWSAKHKMLAADRQVGSPIVEKPKILDAGKYLLAGAGYYDDLYEVALWLSKGADENDKPELPDRSDGDSNFLVVTKETGEAAWLTTPFLRPVPIHEEFYTLGSGGDFALGALMAGANPAKAIAIAIHLDPQSGGYVDVIKLPVKKAAKQKG